MEVLHEHQEVVHGHPHSHVVHYLHEGTEWVHLTASHDHEHGHAHVTHGHEPHENPEVEHLREGHIHDHDHPLEF